MPPRGEPTIDAVLNAPAFAAWRDRVAAAFFDRDALEPVLATVRDEIRIRLEGDPTAKGERGRPGS